MTDFVSQLDRMENFLSIYQSIIEKGYQGSPKDIFKMAIWAYEDEYGAVDDTTAHMIYHMIQQPTNGSK